MRAEDIQVGDVLEDATKKQRILIYHMVRTAEHVVLYWYRIWISPGETVEKPGLRLRRTVPPNGWNLMRNAQMTWHRVDNDRFSMDPPP